MTEDLYDIIGAVFAADLLLTLHEHHALELLAHPRQPSEIAAATSWGPDVTHGALTFLAATTSVVVAVDGGFQLAQPYRGYNALGFHLDKFLRAYGPAVSSMGHATTARRFWADDVDQAALANAFARRTFKPPTLTAQILRAWTVRDLVDLGCGAGSLLVELACADPEFHGWGIDANKAMVDAARALAAEANVTDRVRFATGDVRELATLLPPDDFDATAVHARSLFNEFFADDSAAATEVAAAIRNAFPARLLFVEDYYGRLGTTHQGDFRHGRLQDLVQLASGQGIPPDSFEGWSAVYNTAGCSVLQRYEGHDDGIAWFVHVVQLGPTAAG